MRKKNAAFSLAEVVVALGLATFAMLAVVGMLPVSMASTRNAVNSTEASLIAGRIVEDLQQSASGNATTSRLFGFNLRPGQSSESFLAANGMPVARSEAVYRATVTLAPASVAGAAGNALPAYHSAVRLHWPAAASAANAQGSYELATTLRVAP